MLTVYHAIFYQEDGGYSVIFPDLDHLATYGDTPEDAMGMAMDCLAGYVYTEEQDGKELPAPPAGRGRSPRRGS